MAPDAAHGVRGPIDMRGTGAQAQRDSEGTAPRDSADTGESHDSGRVHLRVLQTTDLHMQLMPFDYTAGRPAPGTGLATAAALIARLRATAANSLLFDTGDLLQGTALGDYIALERGLAPGQTHPAIAAMNTLGYDAITPGNHDFDFGLGFLRRALEAARFPAVCANLSHALGDTPGTDRTLFAPFTLLERSVEDAAGHRHPIRIGVIGFAPPAPFCAAPARGARVQARDIVAAARTWVPRLRAAGADLVIALAHTGIGPAEHRPGMENAAIPLARVPGIDALLAGHTHALFPAPAFAGRPGLDVATGRIEGTPAVMGGSHGTHLGVIDLELRRRTRGWQVRHVGSEVVAAAQDTPPRAFAAPEAGAGTCPAQAVSRAVAPDHAAIRARLGDIVGTTRTPLHNHFAMLGVAPALRLVMQAQRTHVARLLAGTPHARLPILSAVAPFRAGGLGGPANYTDIAAGPLSRRALHDLAPYADTVCAVRVTGAELRDWLERAAAAFLPVAADARDAPLCDPRVPAYTFDLIEGVDYVIDPARAPGDGRIAALTRAGVPVHPDDSFVVVTNSYRATGGGGFRSVAPERILCRPATLTRDALAAHLARSGPVSPSAAPLWRFHARPGSSVVFETGPGAAAHLDSIAHLRPEPLGRGADGYLRLRLHP